MYIHVHFWATSLQANLLLRGTTDIPVRSEDARSLVEIKRRRTCCTSRTTYSSGTDAAGLNSSDISAKPKFAIKSVQGCTLFMMRQRRCPHIFKRSYLWLRKYAGTSKSVLASGSCTRIGCRGTSVIAGCSGGGGIVGMLAFRGPRPGRVGCCGVCSFAHSLAEIKSFCKNDV